MAKKKAEKVPVTERALLARLNRQLAKVGVTIKKCSRNNSAHGELGDYYAVDVHGVTNGHKHIDLEAWGRKHGLLKPYESLAE